MGEAKRRAGKARWGIHHGIAQVTPSPGAPTEYYWWSAETPNPEPGEVELHGPFDTKAGAEAAIPGNSIELEFTDDRCFVKFNGLRIAERREGKWVALVPGYRVTSPAGHDTIDVEVLPLSGSVN